jgi:cellulose synthase/poly-beta-1,6-N-acetylglucosamine synthase-like glycosyltransferase
MSELAIAVVVSPIVAGFYSYVAYPVLLWLATRLRRARPVSAPADWAWPSVTITVPVYNAESNIRRTLQRLTQLEYPRELQILVLSDASTDATDSIVREFAPQGIQLLRAAERRGKTAAENAAVATATGEIIVNVDATVEVPRTALRALVSAFADPSVGVASGRDVSVDAAAATAGGEVGYTGYEMWIRDLETRAGSIVGASGCFFAIRRLIHDEPLPAALSWDFASALVARKKGYRSVSVPDAVCLVPATGAMRSEFRRKSRTMARGLGTLFHFRGMMNPLRYGGFALMLISHKLLRWLPYLLAPFSVLALMVLAIDNVVGAAALSVLTVGCLAGVYALRKRGTVRFRPIALAGFAVAVFTAGFLAWFDALRGEQKITWSPTPRAGVSAT